MGKSNTHIVYKANQVAIYPDGISKSGICGKLTVFYNEFNQPMILWDPDPALKANPLFLMRDELLPLSFNPFQCSTERSEKDDGCLSKEEVASPNKLDDFANNEKKGVPIENSSQKALSSPLLSTGKSPTFLSSPSSSSAASTSSTSTQTIVSSSSLHSSLSPKMSTVSDAVSLESYRVSACVSEITSIRRMNGYHFASDRLHIILEGNLLDFYFFEGFYFIYFTFFLLIQTDRRCGPIFQKIEIFHCSFCD